MNIRPTMPHLLISAVVVTTGFLATFHGSSVDDFGSPTLIRHVTPHVRVNVSNSYLVEGELCRVERNHSFPVASLKNKRKQCFDLPSGTYQLKLKNGIRLAIPAIAELTKELTIDVPLNPQKKSGWCWIPPGPAIIGDTLGVGAEDERPVEICDVAGFWLSPKEVTNQEYAKFLSAQPIVDSRWIDLESRKCRIQKTSSGFRSQAPELPVVMVSLLGAQAYCDWLSGVTGSTCRLPTEKEWEKAARGPESFVYSYGNVYRQRSANQESGLLKNVATYPSNGFGLFDMSGNAFEWMANQYDPQASDSQMNQSLRGGSFVLDGMYLRNSFRMRQSPSVMTDDIGFRVLMEPSMANRQ